VSSLAITFTTTSVIAITSNVAYRLSFWARGTCLLFCGATPPSGDVSLSTAFPGSLADDSTWVKREVEFNVSESDIRLLFGCSSPDPQTLSLDAVSLVPTTGGCPLPVGF
jgi:hypothetical protein